MSIFPAYTLKRYAADNLHAATGYTKEGKHFLALQCLGAWAAYLEIYDWLEDLTLPEIIVRLEAKYARLYQRYADDKIQNARCYGAMNAVLDVKRTMST